MASHGSRFAHDELPTRVFRNPLAFARAVRNPHHCSTVLATMWHRAGATLVEAERQSSQGIRAVVTRADAVTVIEVDPPPPRAIGDACAIAIVGHGDGDNDLDDVRYYVIEHDGARLALKSRSETEDNAPLDPAVSAWYWWHVCRGVDVFRVFCATPEAEAWSVVYRYPVLLMPELVDAAAAKLSDAGIAIDGLRQMHHSLRGTPHFAPYHRMLAHVLANEQGGSPSVNLERALIAISDARIAVAEQGGDHGRIDATEAMIRGKLARHGVDPRANFERALELYAVARSTPAEQADRDADSLDERAIRTAMGTPSLGTATVAPATTDPTWSMLFLDEAELQGFKLEVDKRDTHPSPNDRMFALHGGVCAGSVTWVGSEAWAVHRIFDVRYLFPSTKAASAFVRSRASTMGEGLPALPAPAAGDEAHQWGGKSPKHKFPEQIALFRVGRMVAKLQVTEGSKAPAVFQVLSPNMLRPYAEAIVRRAKWALSQYWLAVVQGTEAADRFAAHPPRTAHQLFAEFPILLLPEFPTAMASLGESHRAAAERLATLQPKFRSNHWHDYRDVKRALVRALLDETGGEPRVNADAALNLVVDHRRLDSDYGWAAVEKECRARTEPGEPG